MMSVQLKLIICLPICNIVPAAVLCPRNSLSVFLFHKITGITKGRKFCLIFTGRSVRSASENKIFVAV